MALIGAHVGVADPATAAAEVCALAVQFFLADPQGWKKPPPREDAEALKAAGIDDVHGFPWLEKPEPKALERAEKPDDDGLAGVR